MGEGGCPVRWKLHPREQDVVSGLVDASPLEQNEVPVNHNEEKGPARPKQPQSSSDPDTITGSTRAGLLALMPAAFRALGLP
ncbi:hypothetical protein DPEC_G00155060 [Dallia pectoralis]|uniref:Uncharacterized protein n=1 Tax=Dallia pectoralis TaxID=75939 RepID=A0ACC2GJZ8_DALPE|nr:hypothetical protein DPEC_G00155060 [Dallia pectoralis]